MTMKNKERIPAMFDHAVKVYDRMAEQSFYETIEGEEVSVYEGFITKLVFDMGIPTPYYSAILNALKQMGSISQIRRGGSTTPSKWVLWAPPTPKTFKEAAEGPKRQSEEAKRLDVVEQQIRDIRELLGGVNVPQALADLSRRIDGSIASSSSVA